MLELRPTWKCSCPGTVLWGNSGRNMAMNPGRLHSALSLSGPTPANLRTCSGMSGALPWSIRRWPRRRAGGARRQRPAGMDRPMLERKPRHPDEKSSSSGLSEDLCRGDMRQWCIKKQLRPRLVDWSIDYDLGSCHNDFWEDILKNRFIWIFNQNHKGPHQHFCISQVLESQMNKYC